MYVPAYRHSGVIADYVANLFTRTRKRREASERIDAEISKVYEAIFSDPGCVQKFAAALSIRFGRPIPLDTVERAWKGSISLTENHKSRFLQAFEDLETTVRSLVIERPYSILKAGEGSSFITTDNPIVTRSIVGQRIYVGDGFQNENLHILLPLTPQHCLQSGLQIENRSLSASEVWQINNDLLSVRYREAYSDYRSCEVQRMVENHDPPLVYGIDIFRLPNPSKQELFADLIDGLWD